MATDTLRPLTSGELLDHAFGMFRRLFVPLVLVQLICSVITFPLGLYVAAGGDRLPGLLLLNYLLAMIFGALASAATALMISENYLGRPLSAIGSLRRALPKVGAVIVLSFLIGLVLVASAVPAIVAFGLSGAAMVAGTGPVAAVVAMLVALGLLVLPLMVFSGVALSTPSLVIEDLRAGAAMSRSWSLTRGARLRTTGLLFVCVLLLLIPYLAVAALTGALNPSAMMAGQGSGGVLLTVASALIMLVFLPVLYCVMTLLYYDLRIRKEAFDLEALAAGLAGSPA